MKTLYIRTASALFAFALLAVVYHFFGADGLRFFTLVAVLIGARELIRILFDPQDPIVIKGVFYLFIVLLFIVTVKFSQLAALGFALISILFFTLGIVYRERFKDLTSLSQFQSKSTLGFLYIGILPAFACKLLDFPKGDLWFFTLMAIVFSGDTTAYLFGMKWGKKLLMPDISPKKTIAGAWGGLIGSVLAAFLSSLLLKDFPMVALIVLGAIAGLIAQFGDLFESVLKRVANTKDSGSLMPGHGGILDRIDGLLFAAPIVYIGALLFQKLL